MLYGQIKIAQSAVIVTGNPEYINNPVAANFYNTLQAHLEGKGYAVSRDPGLEYTMPSKADLWVGHSRGAGRFRFAPKGQRYISIGSSLPGAINHPKATRFNKGQVPDDYHFTLTPKMLEKISADYYHGSVLNNLTHLRPGSYITPDRSIAELMGRYHLSTGKTWTDDDLLEPHYFGKEPKWKNEPKGIPSIYKLTTDDVDYLNNPYEHLNKKRVPLTLL